MSNESILSVEEAVLLSDNIFYSTTLISEVLTSIIKDVNDVYDNCQDSSLSVLINDTLTMLTDVKESLDTSFSLSEQFIKTQYSDYYNTAEDLKNRYNTILEEINALVSKIDTLQPEVLS